MNHRITKNHFTTLGKLFASAFFVIVMGASARAQIITTFAGTGTAGYMGNGGQATDAELDHPAKTCLDDSGNVYIVDGSNNVVRKVSALTGIISAFAGNGYGAGGNGGYSGDGGPATAAELNSTSGVAIDDSGNVYISDYGNFCVRKVTAKTGIISTVAGTPPNGGYSGDGGQATNAQLSYPTAVTLDDSGNLYISDQWNFRIRKVTKATGIITTVAGTGSWGFSGNGGPATNAELALPSDVAVDDSGNIYIADEDNNEMRKVSKKTGIITDYAGSESAAAGYSGDGGLATAAEIDNASGIGIDDSGNIYIADGGNQLVREVSAKTGIITTVAGDYNNGNGGYSGDGGPATDAKLNAPNGVSFDKCGNFYIADDYNNVVRKVTHTGTITVSPLASSICSGSSDTLKASGGASYIWSPAAGLNDTTGAIVVASPTTTTTYTLAGTGGCGGTTVTTLSLIITVTPAPVVNVTPASPSVCAGQNIFLKVTNTGATYQWLGTTDTTDSISVNPSMDTSYELLATTGTCITDTFIAVSVTNAPPLYIEPSSTSICPGTSIVLTVPVSGTDYIWSPALSLNPSTGDAVTATPSAQTIYTVTGIDSLGCSVTASDTISISQAPNKPTISIDGNDLVSSATQGNQWLRNDTVIQGATNQTYAANIGGYYQVIASNPANGCSTESDSTLATGINQLTIESGQLTVYPNPTGGEINVSISTSALSIKEWSIEIYDVLGRTVYTKTSLNYTNDVDLSNLASGVYFICVIDKEKRIVVPVVKQN